jgi:hypothetical protein
MFPDSPGKPEATTLSQTYRDLQGPGSDQCPHAEALASVALGEAPASERDRIADHAVSCRRCSEDLQLLMRTHVEVRGAPAPRRLALLTWISAAAIAAIAVGALLFMRTSRPEDALRGGRAPQEAALVEPADGATIAAAPETLRWPAQPRAEGYRAKLFDSSGETIWESERVTEPSVALPRSAASRLQPGQGYFWRVDVEMALEKRRLGPFSFNLRR